MHVQKFQSTLPRGSDEGLNVMYLGKKVFQSTLPRGSDLWPRYLISASVYFNPRSLAGATGSALRFAKIMDISIHAPSRERQTMVRLPAASAKFQSTLPRGSDPVWYSIYKQTKTISIHAPSRERRSAEKRLASSSWISIHAPSRERPKRLMTAHQAQVFQSTLPRGSDTCFCNNA